ncbi:Hypothetical cytosolic protein [Lactobacillus helveticus H10]|nr:Hypothetical cytosolic protein [Lactobacillus helveticus H10]
MSYLSFYVLDLLGGQPIYEALRLQIDYHKLPDSNTNN